MSAIKNEIDKGYKYDDGCDGYSTDDIRTGMQSSGVEVPGRNKSKSNGFNRLGESCRKVLEKLSKFPLR